MGFILSCLGPRRRGTLLDMRFDEFQNLFSILHEKEEMSVEAYVQPK
jgi:hypothetical protein